jgi:D-psicose/D-tagatose/L-ribulose 3-epimerase
MRLCLFSSTPDIARCGFVVKVLTGTLDELAQRSVEWGYDGIEFLPDPEHVPNPREMETALNAAGALMPVVNSGRLCSQGMALLHADGEIRRRSVEAYKRLLDFAGHFGVRVGLGAARGQQIAVSNPEETDRIAHEVFHELAEYAEKAGAIIMLEPADPGATNYINTVGEAMAWVDRIGSPAFTVMLDTYELATSEPSIEEGIRAARGRATHIHLYDPSRWPPGVLAEGDRLDWQHIARVLREEKFAGSGSVVLPPEGDPEPAVRKAASYLRGLFQ